MLASNLVPEQVLYHTTHSQRHTTPYLGHIRIPQLKLHVLKACLPDCLGCSIGDGRSFNRRHFFDFDFDFVEQTLLL